MGWPVEVVPKGTAQDWVPSGLVNRVPEQVVCLSKAYESLFVSSNFQMLVR